MSSLEKSKFFKSLTSNNGEIKEQRASIVAKKVSGALDNKIQRLNNELTELDLILYSHEDLSPDNTYSLQVATKDFEAEAWLEEYYRILDVQKKKQEQLEIYLKIRDRQFGEEVTEKES